jgi:transposase
MEAYAMTRQDGTNMDEVRPAPRIRSPDRSMVIDPTTIDELVPPDAKARVVWRLVGDLDLTPLYGKIKSVDGHAGRPAVDPRILVALWVYATDEHIGSAHELARRTRDCDPYKWICGGVPVNYHTLAEFRVAHADWLAEQTVALIAAMRAEKSVCLNVIGQDGMRVRASAGSDSFQTADRLSQLAKEAQQRWDQLQHELEQPQNLTPRQRAARLRGARERLKRIQRAQEEVQKLAAQREKRKKGDGETARASTTDPDARRMKMADGGFRPAYNIEFATDLDSLVIVGADVINIGSDAGQLGLMVQRIALEQAPLEAGTEYYVDGSFAIDDDIQSLGQRGITVFAPVKEATRQQQEGKDPYVRRRDDPEHVGAWRERMGTCAAQEQYKQRSLTEFPNATCRNRGLYQLFVRGLEKVKTVIMWFVLTHDLFRRVALCAQQKIATA